MLKETHNSLKTKFWRYVLVFIVISLVDTYQRDTYAGDRGDNLKYEKTLLNNEKPLKKSLALEEAILISLNNRYEINVADMSISQSKNEIGIARAERYPNISLSIANRYENNLNDTDPIEYIYEMEGQTYNITAVKRDQMYNSHTGISMNQSLYSGGLVSSHIRGAKDQLALSKLLKEKEVRDILRSTTVAWFDLKKKQHLVEISKESTAQAKIIFRVAKERHKKGSISKLQRDRADSKQVQSMIRMDSAETERSVAIHLLLKEMGIYDKQQWITAKERLRPYEIIFGDLSEMTKYALKKRPEIQSAYHRLKIKKSELDAAYSNWYPKIDLEGEYLWKGSDDDSASNAWNDIDEDSWNIQLRLSLNLFEGFKAKNEVRAAALGIKSAKKELEGTELNVISEVKTAWEQYNGAKKKLAYCKSSLSLETANMNAVMKEYELGVATVDKVAEYYDSITSAKDQYVNALSDYEKSIIILKWSTGQALP